MITRRELGSAALVLMARTRNLRAASGMDETLRSAIEQRKIPAAVGMVATSGKTIWSGAFGTRDSASGVPVTTGSIFAIASMTKAITSAAALQLVEELQQVATEWMASTPVLAQDSKFERSRAK